MKGLRMNVQPEERDVHVYNAQNMYLLVSLSKPCTFEGTSVYFARCQTLSFEESEE